MTSKTAITNRTIANAIYAARLEGLTEHAAIEARIEDEDMLGRDLTLRERNMVRAWFGLPAYVTETERCA